MNNIRVNFQKLKTKRAKILVICLLIIISIFCLYYFHKSQNEQVILIDLQQVAPNSDERIKLPSSLKLSTIDLPRRIDNIWDDTENVSQSDRRVVSSYFEVKSFYWLRDSEKLKLSNYPNITVGCEPKKIHDLKLSVTVDKVSKYVDGSTSSKIQTLVYPIEASIDLCYLAPRSNAYLSNKISLNQLSYQESYSIDYNINFGFLAHPIESELKFPTTGFNNALFKLVLLKGETRLPDYQQFTFEAQENGEKSESVFVDKEGIVLLRKKPLHPVDIIITPKDNLSNTIHYSFNINQWFANPKLFYSKDFEHKTLYQQSVIRCTDEKRVPTIEQLTNALSNKDAQNDNISNYPIRMINNSLIGEWGDLSRYSLGLNAIYMVTRGGDYAVHTSTGSTLPEKHYKNRRYVGVVCLVE